MIYTGSTRYVVCIGPYAVKIARIKILYWILRVMKWTESTGGITQKVVSTPGHKKWAALKHLFAGVTANLEEIRFWQSHKHLPLAPTLLSLFGFVNIQRRGTVIAPHELSSCPFREHADNFDAGVDLNRVENFGWISNRIHLIDYGYDVVNRVIS
jgi:hypothetical protein